MAQECLQSCTTGVHTPFCVYKHVIVVACVRMCSQNFHLILVPRPASALTQFVQRSHCLSGVITFPMLVSPGWG